MNPVTKCYFDGRPCTCQAFDTVGDCPRDTFVHDEDFDVDTEYEANLHQQGMMSDDCHLRF